MRQMNVVAAACLGGIAVAFCFMFDIFPLFAVVAYLGILAYVALAPDWSKKKPPAEPWYMK
jgi:hypothetical protein